MRRQAKHSRHRDTAAALGYKDYNSLLDAGKKVNALAYPTPETTATTVW